MLLALLANQHTEFRDLIMAHGGVKNRPPMVAKNPADFMPPFLKPDAEPQAEPVASALPSPDLVAKKMRAYANARAEQSRKANEAKAKKAARRKPGQS